MYRIVLDTETANNQFENGKCIKNTALVYDFGFAVVDETANIIEERSYVIKEVFFGESDLMQSAYYSNKIPIYLNDILQGKRIPLSFFEAKKEFYNLIEQYNITDIMAHNAWFDFGALNNTQKYITKSKYRYFFADNLCILDTLRMAREIFGKDEKYAQWCKINNFVTKKSKPQLTAEVLYRYLKNNRNFQENHTGLEDVKIEKEIFAYCLQNGCSLTNILDKYKNNYHYSMNTPLQNKILKLAKNQK